MSKLLVFDVDGTFLNSIHYFGQYVLEYSRKQGWGDVCVESVLLGYSDPDSYDFGWGVSKKEQKVMFHQACKSFEENITKNVPNLYEGAKETLIKLKDMGYSLAVVTSKSEKPLITTFEKHQLDGLFVSQRNYDDIERRGEKEKPEPDMLLSVMNELGFSNDNTIMIGDTFMDVHMGNNAGAKTIAVTWGAHSKEELEKANPTYIVGGEFSNILSLIEKEFPL